ncbi:MAG: insulinase family protein [Candidatus Diapherotrites archaeon]|nr:insulinase family protein [Candidatus Diapherotrites archaeon]
MSSMIGHKSLCISGEETEIFTLKNGAKVLFGKSKSNVFAAELLVNFGSAFEKKRSSGIAHFIEHMFFSGTRKHSRLQISKKIDSVGGYLNAFTSRENIGYLIKTDVKHGIMAINVLLDCFRDCQFYKDQVEIERKIIANEIRDAYDNPTRHTIIEFYRECLDKAFGKPIAGNEKNVLKFKRKDLLFNFRKSHHIKNCLFSIVAPDEPSKYLNSIGIIEPKCRKKPLKLKKCDVGSKHKEVFIEKKIEQTHLCIGFPTVSSFDENYAVLSLLEAILGGGLSSRIVYKIREKHGLSYMAHAFLEAEPKHGIFCIYAATRPDKAKKVTDIIKKELARIAHGKISESELKKAKKHIFGSYAISWEDSLEKARDNSFAYCSGWNWQEYFEKIKMLRLSEVKRVARELIDTKNLCYVYLGPKL